MEESWNLLLHKSDLYSYEYFSQNDVCRLCWQRNTFQEITNNTMILSGIKVEMVSVIQECLDVDLCCENYPNKVCDACWDIVKNFYTFKVCCKHAEVKLKEIIETGPSPSPETQLKTEIIDEIKTYTPELKNVSLKVEAQKQKIIKTQKAKKSKNYCYICCKEFDDEKKFSEHNSECHGIENGTFKCFGCGKKFKNIRTRTSHETHYCKALKQGYKCPVCGRFLPVRRLYEAHMRHHAGNEEDVAPELSENIFKCRQCDASFKTKDHLKEHKASHKSIDNNFVCETCGRVFLRQDYLQKHRLIHRDVRRYACAHCPLRFVQKSSLTVHLRKHTGERPYVCDVCPQRCVSSSNLRAHRRRHLGLKLFECAACGKRFGYKLSLTEHMATAHAPEPPHCCALCGARYMQRRGLARHAAREHPAHPAHAHAHAEGVTRTEGATGTEAVS